MSFKTSFTRYLAYLLTMNKQDENFPVDLTDNVLVLVTAAGTIKGTPTFSIPEEEKDITQFIFGTAFETAIKNENSNSSKDCILLKNATLITGNTSCFFSYLFIFVDDIIGLSISGSDNN